MTNPNQPPIEAPQMREQNQLANAKRHRAVSSELERVGRHNLLLKRRSLAHAARGHEARRVDLILASRELECARVWIEAEDTDGIGVLVGDDHVARSSELEVAWRAPLGGRDAHELERWRLGGGGGGGRRPFGARALAHDLEARDRIVPTVRHEHVRAARKRVSFSSALCEVNARHSASVRWENDARQSGATIMALCDDFSSCNVSARLVVACRQLSGGRGGWWSGRLPVVVFNRYANSVGLS